MSTLGYILLFTFIGSIGSLIGGMILLTKEKFASKISHFLSAFAAGALLGTAFFDLLPEGFEEAEHIFKDSGTEINIFFWTLVGFLTFFVLERAIHWSHHHQSEEEKSHTKGSKSIVPLVIIGDSVHNFLDGIIIASTFLVSIPLGIMTSLAVAAHEIPQEIGDFGILIHRGVKRAKVLWLNILSASVAFAGAILAYFTFESVQNLIPVFLSLAAGFFIYIAASDLIPEIHNEEKKSVALAETLLLILGIIVVYLSVIFLEGFITH